MGRDTKCLPMLQEDRLELFEKVVALCNNNTFHCRAYKEFMRGYMDMYQINISISEMGLESDIADLCGYEIKLEHENL